MKNVDARIVNSKKFLKEALLSLLFEKKISDIKIVALCERAEINRATFYSHYKNVYQLFEEIIDDFMDEICLYISNISEAKSSKEKSSKVKDLLKNIDRNSELFVMIFENSNNFEFSSNQYSKLQDKIHHRIKSSNTVLSTYITNYYIYGGGAILYTWVKNGKKESYEEIGKMLYTFLNKGVSYYASN